MAIKFYITTGTNGGIWIGKPNSLTNPNPLTREVTGVTETLYQVASDLTANVSTFKVVTVGVEGSILLSVRTGNQSSTWTKVKTASQPLVGVAYGNGHWVACGSKNTILTSTNGSTWVERKGAVKTADWQWMAYGNGTFIACGTMKSMGTDIGVIQYSTDDGTTWTQGNAGGASPLNAIAYSPELNVFVAVGDKGSIVSVQG